MQNRKHISIDEAKRIADSDAAKKLFSSLQASNQKELNNAMKQANAGDLDQLKNTITKLLSTPETQEFLKQLREGK